ncbi:class IIb bacteriocin, lactobin A/cerein 7B family [Streptococcus ruminantium]|uniref:class IIb bacteriocin, lactobin A/cerein 7B family n=1 Tax=Streptococcus ruminantium TaxID=1917441 RepID=UPI0012DE9CAD|nr:class IIb bacteriocin, lactobin A/cerein 7B family [Streptococcus ruminantium]
MITFEKDNMNNHFVVLSDQELMELEGGGIIIGILVVGGAITTVAGGTFALGAIDGYSGAKAKRKGY